MLFYRTPDLPKPQQSSAQVKNRTFGSTLLISGTAIGAGMLAMPLACATLGFATTCCILVALWALTSYTALLMLEIHQHHQAGSGLTTLAEHYLGGGCARIVNFALLWLLYALTTAYLTGGGRQLSFKLTAWLHTQITPQLGILIFGGVIAAVVTFGAYLVDRINRLLFTLKIAVLILMLGAMAPHIQLANLTAAPLSSPVILAAIPLIFTAFGFHGSIPSIVLYMQGDTKKLRHIFLVGSTIPLLTYLVWQLAVHGIFPQEKFVALLHKSSSVEGLTSAIHQVVHNSKIEVATELFANLALTTSLLGVALGLFDHLADLGRFKGDKFGRLKTSLATFLPPIGMALLYPDNFIRSLGYAAIALSFLAIIMPVCMVFILRRQGPQPLLHKQKWYRVVGGYGTLLFVFLSGLAIIAIQVVISSGYFA